MAPEAKQPAAPSQKGIVHIRTQGSFGGGDKVLVTTHGCSLKDRDRELRCCNWFAISVREIKASDCVTTVEGLGKNLRHELIVADLKKKLRCKGGTYRTEEAGVVIRLHTDQAEEVKKFLWKSGLAEESMIHCIPSG